MKYDPAVQWLDDIEAQLVDAAEKLRLAIKDTENIDEASRKDHLNQLNKILNPKSYVSETAKA